MLRKIQKHLILLGVFVFIIGCIAPVSAAPVNTAGSANQQINYADLKDKPIDNPTAETLAQKFKSGDKQAQEFVLGLAAFAPNSFDAVKGLRSGQRHTFPDGSWIEVGTCVPDSSLDSLNNGAKLANTASATVSSIYPCTIQDEKYVGVGIGSIYFGAYFNKVNYYCYDHNHTRFNWCSDRSEAVYPYQINPMGCRKTGSDGVSQFIGGQFWYSSGIYNVTRKTKMVVFPEYSMNYMQIVS